ncbi:MAG: tRNA pseudouridine synthase A, partial [bacterium]|nr:tRNA pseudouridine synthase A [bacterium]
MRYFLRLAYCGTPFHGWQIQPHDVSVQETLEKALSTALRTPIALTGAGRTDTGVHAATMIAHFDVEQPIADAHKFLRQINAMVGYDIAVQGICPVHDDAHARFDAVSRTYKYYLHTEKNPFLGQVSWHCHYALNFEQMNLAAQQLLQYIDFTSFSKLHTDVKTNNCRIT